jgi:hypothetical protein
VDTDVHTFIDDVHHFDIFYLSANAFAFSNEAAYIPYTIYSILPSTIIPFLYNEEASPALFFISSLNFFQIRILLQVVSLVHAVPSATSTIGVAVCSN